MDYFERLRSIIPPHRCFQRSVSQMKLRSSLLLWRYLNTTKTRSQGWWTRQPIPLRPPPKLLFSRNQTLRSTCMRSPALYTRPQLPPVDLGLLLCPNACMDRIFLSCTDLWRSICKGCLQPWRVLERLEPISSLPYR